jgi:hypothetical protein
MAGCIDPQPYHSTKLAHSGRFAGVFPAIRAIGVTNGVTAGTRGGDARWQVWIATISESEQSFAGQVDDNGCATWCGARSNRRIDSNRDRRTREETG